jgi:hypothetical protein
MALDKTGRIMNVSGSAQRLRARRMTAGKKEIRMRPRTRLNGLLLKIVAFAFLGVGWDVLVTLTQQLLAGQADRNALCPASAWMYVVYGCIPLGLSPVLTRIRTGGWPYPVRILLGVAALYGFELLFAHLFAVFSITAWNYRWWLQPRWSTADGFTCWHPVIVLEWTVFVVLIDQVNQAFDDWWSRGEVAGSKP